MGCTRSQEEQRPPPTPFDTLLEKQRQELETQLRMERVETATVAGSLKDALPEVWDHYDDNNDGTLQEEEFDPMLKDFLESLERWIPKFVETEYRQRLHSASDADKPAIQQEEQTTTDKWMATIQQWSNPEDAKYIKREKIVHKSEFIEIMAKRIWDVSTDGELSP
eukprot:TRINITY_DN11968_c0_g2_i1.p1 TRINITY_DN11968_c0_g2~~TRINITY_DN11968_c0_g2_i1.p1  ORF type:complete len:166 (-),score=56.59 TRINITY_DN11968_c0_g2_i1:174-671(-)